jgi:hypothetical protein
LARIDPDQFERFRKAIHAHDHLHRILREVERLQRIVFHEDDVDLTQMRRSAEQILAAELVTRYHADVDRVYFALRNMENSGKSWAASILELASSMHSYYTTPLGIMIRLELFGDDAVFISPEARRWAEQARTRTSPAAEPQVSAK